MPAFAHPLAFAPRRRKSDRKANVFGQFVPTAFEVRPQFIGARAQPRLARFLNIRAFHGSPRRRYRPPDYVITRPAAYNRESVYTPPMFLTPFKRNAHYKFLASV